MRTGLWKIKVYCIAGTILVSLLLLPAEVWAQNRETLLDQANRLDQEIAKKYQQGNYAQAIPLAREALVLRERALGPTHPQVAATLNNLAVMMRGMGDHTGARPLYERALKIDEKIYGPMHPQVAGDLNNLAELEWATGNYDEARKHLVRVLKIQEHALGPAHPDLAMSLMNMGELLQSTGDYEGARPLLQRALKIQEQALGPTHPNVALTLASMAEVLRSTGEYSEARPLLQRALKIQEQTLGPTHPYIAVNLNRLALLLQYTGDYAQARPLFERAIAIQEQLLGPSHSEVAKSLSNLAVLLLESSRDYAGARPLLEKALRIQEQSFGPDHPVVAATLINLAMSLQGTGEEANSLPLLRRALKIQEAALGTTHPDVATSLDNLAGILYTTGDYTGAQPLYERALSIRRQAFGPSHPDVARSLNNLALLVWDVGEIQQAARLLEEATSIADRHTRRALRGMAERQKLVFLRMTESYVANYLSLPATVVSARAAYAAAMTRKNLVFRVLAEERMTNAKATDPVVRRMIQRTIELRQKLAGLVYAGGDKEKRVTEVERELENAEAELSRNSAVFRKEQAEAQTGPTDLCQALPSDTTLVDYFRFRRYIPHQGFQPGYWTDNYTVFVLRGGRCADVQWFELGPAEPIDVAATAFREELTTLRTVNGQQEPLSEAGILTKAQALGTLVLPSRVRAAIVGASTLLAAPDGPLALIPFKLLPGDDGHSFLLLTRTVATIPSGRDVLRLLRKEDAAKPAAGLVLVGNPDFGATVVHTGGSAPSRATVRAGCGLEAAASFDPLPGTAEEVRAIARQASLNMRSVTLRQAEGRTATEAWLSQQMTGQRYVHLATHGYFSGESCAPPSAPASRGVIVHATLQDEFSGPVGTNPLLLSGIALAGANRRAQVQSGADDGILTALEVTGLDLQGTDLVVLSACETGLGAQQAGQELLGLRWAFGMAGAHTLLTSLWKVPDEPTVRLMTKFYGYLWRSPKDGGPLGKAAALRQAQLDLMKENRTRFNGDSRPNDWGAWVLSGDWR